MLEEKTNPVAALSLAGEVATGFDDASELPGRLDRYATAHHRTLLMANYIKNVERIKTFRDLADTLKNCGSYLCFHDYYTVGKIRLSAASFCQKHLLCPLCAIRRGAKSLQAYLGRLEVITAADPSLKPYLVTFTVKNGKDLTERFNHIKAAMARLQVCKRDYERGKGAHYEIVKAVGGVGSFEFKRGTGSKLWHPHYHAVWLCRVAPCAATLAKEWKMVTGDSHIVHVQPFHDDEDIVGGFCEVFKYALKFSTMGYKDNFDGFLSLSGRRLVNSFGAFRGVVVPESNEDDLLDDLPYIERFYSYHSGGYHLSREPIHKDASIEEPLPVRRVSNPVRSANAPLDASRRRFETFEKSRQDISS